MDPQEKILTEGTEAPDVVPAPPVEHELPELLAAPVAPVAPVPPVAPVLGEELVVQAPAETAKRAYPSLYDSTWTTLAAIVMGLAIIGGIQFIVARMYQSAKNEQEYLTRFVTGLVGLVMGAYIADLLIAGPDTSLLSSEEHLTILGFVKDVCLMVFAYFFGTKSAPSPQPPSE